MRASAIGFGTWPIGGTEVAEGYGGVDEQDAINAIHKALDLGITLFDTADSYGLGRAERILGKALGPRRKDIVLVSKFSEVYYTTAEEWGYNSQYWYTKRSCEMSLKRLGTDYLDLYLIHGPDPHCPFEETMKALNELKEEGKIRYIGVSNFSVEQMAECMKYGTLVANQMLYNIFDRRIEKNVIPFCKENGIGVMAYSSLCFGLLSGTMTAQTTFGPNDWRSSGAYGDFPVFKRPNFERNLAMVEKLKEMAKKYDRSVAQLAMNWVLSNPVVSVALTGPTKPEQIEENVKGADWRISAEDLAEIDRLHQETLAGWVDWNPEGLTPGIFNT